MQKGLVYCLFFIFQPSVEFWVPGGCGSTRNLGHLIMVLLGMDLAVLPPLGPQWGNEEVPPAITLQMAFGYIYQNSNWRPVPS